MTVLGSDPAVHARRALWQSVALALGTASALGLGRFSYGLLVPAMRSELGWSLGFAGLVASVNSAGYLIGALVTPVACARLGVRTTFRLGLLLTVLTLAGSGLATSVDATAPLILGTRALAGIACALAFIGGGLLAAHLATASGADYAVSVYFAGAGLGVIAAGAALPSLLAGHPARWPLAWFMLAAGATIMTLVAWCAPPGPPGSGNRPARAARRPAYAVSVSYLLFGLGYLAYLTFLSAYLSSRGIGPRGSAALWVLLGVGACLTPWVWGRLKHAEPERAFAAALTVVGSAALLPLLTGSAPTAVFISAAVFGVTFMAVPTAAANIVRARQTPGDWAATLSLLTAYFALGQTVGPWLAGLAGMRGGPMVALGWTAACCLVAALTVWAADRRRLSAPGRR